MITSYNQALKRARPFARRALIILRPFFVDIRARNPCVWARFKQLGWNVRFIALNPVGDQRGARFP